MSTPATDAPRGFLRRLWLDGKLHEDVRKGAVLGFLSLVGIGAWELSRLTTGLEADGRLRQEFYLQEVRGRIETLDRFASDIPRNLLLLGELCALRGWLSTHLPDALDADGRPIRDPHGRTYAEVRADHAGIQRQWVDTTRHYNSVCAEVRARFVPVGHEGRGLVEMHALSRDIARNCDILCELFDALNGLYPVVGELASESARLRGAYERRMCTPGAELAAALTSDDAAQQVRLAGDAACAGDPGEHCDRLRAAICAEIDRLYGDCIPRMQRHVQTSMEMVLR